MPIADFTRHLLVFARQPELGRVKTRLAQGIGAEAALAVYAELLQHTRAVVAATPATTATIWLAAAQQPTLPDYWPSFLKRTQPEGDLGHRMQFAFKAAFTAGAERVVIIGTDCPGLTTDLLTAAFDHLATSDVVLGPATDGGYYLLGMRRLLPGLFKNKNWSTATVLTDTLVDISQLGLTVQLLPLLRDVDTASDLAAWRAGL